MRWEKHKIADNKGKPLDIWISGDYQICQDIRAPSTDGYWSEDWLFGIYHKKQHVSEAATLARAKELAAIHESLGDDF